MSVDGGGDLIKSAILLPGGVVISAGEATSEGDKGGYIKSVSFDFSANDGEDLTVGSVCSQKIEVAIITPNNALSLNAGDVVQLKQDEFVDGRIFRTTIGTFIAEKPKRLGAHTTSFVAYDNVSKLDKDISQYLDELYKISVPVGVTLYSLATDVCIVCGVKFGISSSDNMPFGDELVDVPTGDGITGRQVMRWISEMCGCYCIANSAGEIVLEWYRDKGKVIAPASEEPEDGIEKFRYLAGGLECDDIDIRPVDCVRIIPIEYSDDENPAAIVWPNDGGQYTNPYVVETNPLLHDVPADVLPVADHIYNAVRISNYRPCKVRISATNRVGVGDIVTVRQVNGDTFTAYISKKSRKGQIDTIECTGNYERNGVLDTYGSTYVSGYSERRVSRKNSSRLTLLDSEMKAKVSSTGGSDDRSFSWSLTADGFFLRSNDELVMEVDKNGASITGIVNADRGSIGGWEISEDGLVSDDTTSVSGRTVYRRFEVFPAGFFSYEHISQSGSTDTSAFAVEIKNGLLSLSTRDDLDVYGRKDKNVFMEVSTSNSSTPWRLYIGTIEVNGMLQNVVMAY